MSGWLWGGRGSVVRALAAKARGPGFDSRRLPGLMALIVYGLVWPTT